MWHVVKSKPTALQSNHWSRTRHVSLLGVKKLALNIRDCLSLCLSEETLKAVGPFYLVSMPGEVKDPTSLHWKCVPSNALTSDDLDTQRARVQILLFVAVLFIYRRTFYTCS